MQVFQVKGSGSMNNKIIFFITSSMVIFSLTSCSSSKETKEITNAASTEIIETGYNFTASTLNLDRPKRDRNTPMGEEGTWTVFVYICGSDLESQNGGASADIKEMINSSANDKIKFVIETGGAETWKSDISDTVHQRYEISNGKATLIKEVPDKSMGESDVLADFLTWGIDNYPAANMGLILWDHGGGVKGVCSDSNHDRDILQLRELDAALYSVYDKMTEPFEFIGFDACIMSTVENAALMASHANYMVSSEETE